MAKTEAPMATPIFPEVVNASWKYGVATPLLTVSGVELGEAEAVTVAGVVALEDEAAEVFEVDESVVGVEG